MSLAAMGLAVLAALLACSTATAAPTVAAPAAAAPEEVDSPPPDWQRYKQLGETAIHEALASEPNWTIQWPNGYLRRRWHRKGQPYGYVTCGELRATGPVTGRYPRTDFLIVVVGDAVETLNIGTTKSSNNVARGCRYLAQHNYLPPAAAMEMQAAAKEVPAAAMPAGSTAPSEANQTTSAIASLGLTIQPMAEGAYITAVSPGSSAARIGLTPGIVITRANGIPLAGLGLSIDNLLGASTALLKLDTASGGHFELRRAP